jgi:hypothetical protein
VVQVPSSAQQPVGQVLMSQVMQRPLLQYSPLDWQSTQVPLLPQALRALPPWHSPSEPQHP